MLALVAKPLVLGDLGHAVAVLMNDHVAERVLAKQEQVLLVSRGRETHAAVIGLVLAPLLETGLVLFIGHSGRVHVEARDLRLLVFVALSSSGAAIGILSACLISSVLSVILVFAATFTAAAVVTSRSRRLKEKKKDEKGTFK